VEKSLSEDRGPERAEKGPLLYVLWRRPVVLAFLLVQVLFSFVYAQAGFSLPLQLSAFFGEQGPQRFGLLMSVNGLVVIFLTTPLIYITERVNPLLSVSLAGILYALGFGMIPLIRGMGLFVLSTAVWTLGEILWATNSNVYIAGHTPMSHRGRFNSIAPIMTRAGNALGPPLMGAFIERFGVAEGRGGSGGQGESGQAEEQESQAELGLAQMALEGPGDGLGAHSGIGQGEDPQQGQDEAQVIDKQVEEVSHVFLHPQHIGDGGEVHLAGAGQLEY
jgi:hypothetical protein